MCAHIWNCDRASVAIGICNRAHEQAKKEISTSGVFTVDCVSPVRKTNGFLRSLSRFSDVAFTCGFPEQPCSSVLPLPGFMHRGFLIAETNVSLRWLHGCLRETIVQKLFGPSDLQQANHGASSSSDSKATFNHSLALPWPHGADEIARATAVSPTVLVC